MLTRDAIVAKLQTAFTSVFGADVIVSEQLSANDVAEWDSLNHIRLIVAVQKAFGVRFTAAEVGSLKTVGELTTLIERKTA